MNPLVSINENKATTTSLLIAESFDKRHADILRSITSLECSDEFTERNFAPSAYKDGSGRMLPAFNITRDGFTWLAMGFTGKKAAEFKERFIAAFNTMEKALIAGQGERRQVDVNFNHKCGITNPHGLDIKYSLDLTKIALKPTRAGLDILQRLTGINMEDIELAENHCLTSGQATRRQEVQDFIAEQCQTEPGSRVGATPLYIAYLQWRGERAISPVSQKVFGCLLIELGFQRGKSGSKYYADIRLNSEDVINHP